MEIPQLQNLETTKKFNESISSCSIQSQEQSSIIGKKADWWDWGDVFDYDQELEALKDTFQVTKYMFEKQQKVLIEYLLQKNIDRTVNVSDTRGNQNIYFDEEESLSDEMKRIDIIDKQMSIIIPEEEGIVNQLVRKISDQGDVTLDEENLFIQKVKMQLIHLQKSMKIELKQKVAITQKLIEVGRANRQLKEKITELENGVEKKEFNMQTDCIDTQDIFQRRISLRKSPIPQFQEHSTVKRDFLSTSNSILEDQQNDKNEMTHGSSMSDMRQFVDEDLSNSIGQKGSNKNLKYKKYLDNNNLSISSREDEKLQTNSTQPTLQAIRDLNYSQTDSKNQGEVDDEVPLTNQYISQLQSERIEVYQTMRTRKMDIMIKLSDKIKENKESDSELWRKKCDILIEEKKKYLAQNSRLQRDSRKFMDENAILHSVVKEQKKLIEALKIETGTAQDIDTSITFTDNAGNVMIPDTPCFNAGKSRKFTLGMLEEVQEEQVERRRTVVDILDQIQQEAYCDDQAISQKYDKFRKLAKDKKNTKKIPERSISFTRNQQESSPIKIGINKFGSQKNDEEDGEDNKNNISFSKLAKSTCSMTSRSVSQQRQSKQANYENKSQETLSEIKRGVSSQPRRKIGVSMRIENDNLQSISEFNSGKRVDYSNVKSSGYGYQNGLQYQGSTGQESYKRTSTPDFVSRIPRNSSIDIGTKLKENSVKFVFKDSIQNISERQIIQPLEKKSYQDSPLKKPTQIPQIKKSVMFNK